MHKTALLLALAALAYGQDKDDGVRSMPRVNVSQAQIKAYEADPVNNPKLDFEPSGIEPQPNSAGKGDRVILKPAIIGGENAWAPWHVYIAVDDEYACAGSLISDTWILTAASCVHKAKKLVVSAGDGDRSTIGDKEVVQTVKRKACVHQHFEKSSLANDIALVKLNTPWTLDTNNVNAIRLPRKSDASISFVGETMTAVGYGVTSDSSVDESRYLQYMNAVVISNANCASVYGTSAIQSTTMCTEASSTKGPCRGDQGGILFWWEWRDSTKIAMGIFSFHSASSCLNNPAAYTRITSYLGWISKKTGIAIRD